MKSCTLRLANTAVTFDFVFIRNLRSLSDLNKFSGDFVDMVTPVPIPNTEVKPVGADGTARETAWESRKSPGLIRRSPLVNSSGLFLFPPPRR